MKHFVFKPLSWRVIEYDAYKLHVSTPAIFGTTYMIYEYPHKVLFRATVMPLDEAKRLAQESFEKELAPFIEEVDSLEG